MIKIMAVELYSWN